MPDQADGWQKWIIDAEDFVQRRLVGDHEADETGFDPEFHDSVFMPLFRPMYRKWFRVQMRGLEHVPDTGAALVVANHSGVLPFDALMLQAGLYDEHPAHRNLRVLSADLVYELPVLSDLARRSGHIRADPEQAPAVDPGDAPAAGADVLHVHRREARDVSREDAVEPGLAGELHLAVPDDAAALYQAL